MPVLTTQNETVNRPIRVPLNEYGELCRAGLRPVHHVEQVPQSGGALDGELLSLVPGDSIDEVAQCLDGLAPGAIAVDVRSSHGAASYTGRLQVNSDRTVHSDSSTREMSDERLIRRTNLKLVCDQRQLKAQDLSTRYFGSTTYWYGLLNGSKHFGEKAARKIEAEMGLPDRWLDVPHTTPEARDMASAAPRSAPAAGPATPSIPDVDDGFEDVIPDTHWRQVAEMLADVCTQRNIPMLPATFLVIVDAAVELIGDSLDQRQVGAVFSKLWRVLQHGKGQKPD